MGCEQSGVSGTGWSAGLSFMSSLLVHISNYSKLACLLGNSYCSISSCPWLHPVVSSICLSPCHPPFLHPLLVHRQLQIPSLSCQKQVWVCCAVPPIQVGQPSCCVTTKLSLSVQELNGGTHFVLCAASHFHKT